MRNEERLEFIPTEVTPFFDRTGVRISEIPVADGVPFGVEKVSNPEVGIGGAYGAWGEAYDNASLPGFIEQFLGRSLEDEEVLNLGELGFMSRHHSPELSDEEHVELEVAVGVALLREAAQASGWEPGEVEAVLIGITAPVTPDYTQRIAREAGIPDRALLVSVHKACDSSMGALHLALNPDLAVNGQLDTNLAQELYGKKVLIGGIEGLSRFLRKSSDTHALQLFANGAGVIGVVPGQSLKFLAGREAEVFDEEGVLKVQMLYPHSGRRIPGRSLLEDSRVGESKIQVAGLMPEPDDGSPIDMAGPMGMVKLFVRQGVEVVKDAYVDYRKRMYAWGEPHKTIAAVSVHHANLKINILKARKLNELGISLPMSWLVGDFGNVSAASNLIAFLRQLEQLRPGDHLMFDGFGAGTYYDAFVVELGRKPGL